MMVPIWKTATSTAAMSLWSIPCSAAMPLTCAEVRVGDRAADRCYSRLYRELTEFRGTRPNADRRQPTYRPSLGMYDCLSVNLSCYPALSVDADIDVVPFMVERSCVEGVCLS